MENLMIGQLYKAFFYDSFLSQVKSSCLMIRIKYCVLQNFAIFTEKHLRWSLFSIKLQALRPAALLKRDSTTDAFL